MFDRFTDEAREVVVFAQEEARALKHNYIGTEHLLLGLLRENKGMAGEVLDTVGLTLDRVRAQVLQIVGWGAEGTHGQIPFTPRSKRCLEHAVKEALRQNRREIGTEHVLLGLLQEDEGVAFRVLSDLDVDPEIVRSSALALMKQVEETGEPPPVRPASSPPAYVAAPSLMPFGDVSVSARLLLALLSGDSPVAKFLRDRGVTEESVRERFGDPP